MYQLINKLLIYLAPNGTLTDTTPTQSGPENNGNEGMTAWYHLIV